jgi:chemotaxis protein histidine kinase CheA
MSAAMGFEEIVALAQATEALLGEMRGRQVRLSDSSGRKLAEANALLREMIAARGDGRIAADDPGLLSALGEATFESKSPAATVDP